MLLPLPGTRFSFYTSQFPNSHQSFWSLFYTFPRWRICLGRPEDGEGPAPKRRCWVCWWRSVAYCGDTGLSGGSGNLILELWNCLAASGCHFAGSDLHLHDLNWEGLGTHVTGAEGDSTCCGHVWVLLVHLQTILPKFRWRICFMHNLRYAKYEHLVFYK